MMECSILKTLGMYVKYPSWGYFSTIDWMVFHTHPSLEAKLALYVDRILLFIFVTYERSLPYTLSNIMAKIRLCQKSRLMNDTGRQQLKLVVRSSFDALL